VHCSFADQVDDVADRYYRGADVVLLAIDPSRLPSPVRVEQVEGTAYPHVYGPLPLDAVVAVREVTVVVDPRQRNESGGHDGSS
jgi:uncharacterized protein (DUF952 family)